MPAKPYETVAVFMNKAACYRVSPNEKAAWNLAREWLLRGIEERARGYIIGPTLIAEVYVREHDPARWDKTPEPAEAEPSRIILPTSVETIGYVGDASNNISVEAGSNMTGASD